MTYIWDDRLRQYDFGPGHPLSPIRNLLAHKLVESFGLLDADHVTVRGEIEPVTDEDLLRAHRQDFIDSVKLASEHPGYLDLARGLGTEDVPVFADMHTASARICGATLAAAQAVHSGDAVHAVNLSGGLHHAKSGQASGFCVYNDIAVGIHYLLDQGVDRVVYIDVDVHHGDGVEEIFWNDPRVMTISLHESGKTLFPQSGWPEEVGGEFAKGSAVNVALPAGIGNDQWLRAFDGVVPDLVTRFRPDVIVSQQGCDTHRNDPLAHLRLTMEGQRESYQRIHRLAHDLCEGRWIAVGGGGYDWLDAVPRAWTHLTAIAADAPIECDEPVPESYRRVVHEAFGGVDCPTSMGDGAKLSPLPWGTGFDPVSRLDDSIARTRDAVFGFHELDPGSPFF